MTSREDYSEQEWFLLTSTPAMVGGAMAGAGKSGIFGTIKEAMASVKSIVSAEKKFPDSELLGAIVERVQDKDEAKARAEKYRDMAKAKIEARNIKTPEELRAFVVESCSDVATLLQHKSSPVEAQQYKEWLMHVATQVANAAREGGFLGIGGERVSAGERTLMDDIARALGTAHPGDRTA